MILMCVISLFGAVKGFSYACLLFRRKKYLSCIGVSALSLFSFAVCVYGS
ncbi:MAG: hypothetical protein SPL89_01835 [Clostridia bacterium]|nr:hypothetical protein [Clostridia bacterium]